MNRPETDVPETWAKAAHRIVAGEARRIMVVGPRDVGKSTFCGFLLSEASASGRSALVIDADVGQKMIGPPACVTRGRMHASGAIVLDALAFVGGTDPVRGWQRLVAGAAQLAPATTDLLIVNTGGLLAGPGRGLTAAMVTVLSPDLLAVLGSGSDLDAVLSDHPRVPALVMPTSPEARHKTAGERREARRAAFRAYFTGAESWIAPAALAADGATEPGALPPPGLLVGLEAATGCCLALGIVTATDRAADAITVFSPAPRARVARLRWGELMLDENFRDARAAIRESRVAAPST